MFEFKLNQIKLSRCSLTIYFNLKKIKKAILTQSIHKVSNFRSLEVVLNTCNKERFKLL
jgi:hypothetical protein